MTSFAAVLAINADAKRMPRMKEAYFTYDDGDAGAQGQQLELDGLYEDVGDKFDGSDPRPGRKTRQVQPKGKFLKL